MRRPVQPNFASSSASLQPASASVVARAFRIPCELLPLRPAASQALRNHVAKASLTNGLPRCPAMKVSSPIGPQSIASSNSSVIAIATRSFVFSVLMRMTPSLRWGRPTRTASPRRKPVAKITSKATRSRALADTDVPDVLTVPSLLAVQVRRSGACHVVDHGTLSRPEANGSSGSSNGKRRMTARLASRGIIRMTPSGLISMTRWPGATCSAALIARATSACVTLAARRLIGGLAKGDSQKPPQW